MYSMLRIIMYSVSFSRETFATQTLRGRLSSQICYKGDSSCIVIIILLYAGIYSIVTRTLLCRYHIIMYGRLETAQIFPHCEHVSPCREESEHNKRELMEFTAAENAHGRYTRSRWQRDGSYRQRPSEDAI